jgi:hypothetical protein
VSNRTTHAANCSVPHPDFLGWDGPRMLEQKKAAGTGVKQSYRSEPDMFPLEAVSVKVLICWEKCPTALRLPRIEAEPSATQ